MKKDRKFNPEISDIARKQIGDFFRDRRQSLGLSQDELAACAGMTQQHLSRFEAGEQNVTINTLLALAGCLRLKIFFEESDPETPVGFEPVIKS